MPRSVIYNEHKGWYSFVLGSCYGFLLTFGFIMMTPQVLLATSTIGMSSSEKLIMEYAIQLLNLCNKIFHAALHQLQAEERCPPSMEDDDLQG